MWRNEKKYKELRRTYDEVSNTKEAALLRDYRLRRKKRYGIWRKRYRSLAQVLFPGVTPRDYKPGEEMEMYVNLVESQKIQVPFHYYDLSSCLVPQMKAATTTTIGQLKQQQHRSKLGSRLQGDNVTSSPFPIFAKQNVPCTPLCLVSFTPKKLRCLRRLVEEGCRVHLTLDQMPVLVRNKHLNYAVRGYSV